MAIPILQTMFHVQNATAQVVIVLYVWLVRGMQWSLVHDDVCDFNNLVSRLEDGCFAADAMSFPRAQDHMM